MAEQVGNPTIPRPFCPLVQAPTLGRRVGRMALLWSLLGAGIGASTAPSSDLIGLVSGILAGLIVLVPMGALLGLIGGRVKPVLVGVLCGAGVGALIGLLDGAPIPSAFVQVGLIGGGLAGATTSALVWWARFVARAIAPLPDAAQSPRQTQRTP